MKYFTFFRESNKFDDILNDAALKKQIHLKLNWYQHLIIGCADITDGEIGYLTLKFGDDLRSITEKDYTPKPNVDYIPIRR
jgi:hypothetical protein